MVYGPPAREGEEAESAGTGSPSFCPLCGKKARRQEGNKKKKEERSDRDSLVSQDRRGMEASRSRTRPARVAQKPNPWLHVTTKRYSPNSLVSALLQCTSKVHSHTPSLAPFFVRVRLREWQIQPEVQMRVEFFVGAFPPAHRGALCFRGRRLEAKTQRLIPGILLSILLHLGVLYLPN